MGDIGLILPANIPDLSPWLSKNRYNHTDFSVPQLATTVQEKNLSITVLIPAKEVSSTIGDVIRRTVRPLLDARVIHRIVVIDAASQDGTAGLAIEAGSQVLQRADIASELGSSLGKGDALWRGLLATDGDIVAFLDGDTEDPVPAHLIGIIGPLIMFDGIQMVRACFDRPFKSRNGNITPHGGGRVTEIMARPILNMHWPELAVFRQPLAGEFAARRTMLEELHFPVGYGVEIGTLIDAYHLVGLDALAEVDIGQRQNVHKPLRDLTTMAGTVLATAEQRRLSQQSPTGGKMYIPWLNIHQEIDTTERPPIRRYRASHQQYPSPPFVTVGHVRMFRDIGGDPTSSLRPGLIFRSGDASTLTQSGVKILLELGIRTIFDLRSPIELKDHSEVHGTNNENTPNHSPYQIYPNRISEFGIERVAAPVFADEEWHQDRRAARLMQYSNAAQGYAEAYMYSLQSANKPLTPILQHLAQLKPSPILVHCTAGKDRTGITAMIVLLLAGCDDDSIAEEYALNDLDSNRSWGISATNRLLAQPGIYGNVGAVENVIQARKEYMLATLERFKAEYGDVETYLDGILGIDNATITAIKRNIRKSSAS